MGVDSRVEEDSGAGADFGAGADSRPGVDSGVRGRYCLQGRTKPWVIGSVAPFFKVPLVR